MSRYGRIVICLLYCLVQGYALYGQERFSREYDLPEELRNTAISKLFQDDRGYIWIGSDQGLWCFDGLRYQVRVRAEEGCGGSVTSISQDRSGNIWVGYESGCIVLLRPQGQPEIWRAHGVSVTVPITDFAETDDGLLWISTYGSGVYAWDGGRLYNWKEADGLRGNDIYTMIAAPDGDGVWVGTDRGIDRCLLRSGRASVIHIPQPDSDGALIIRKLLRDECGGHVFAGTYEDGIIRFAADGTGAQWHFSNWSWGILEDLECLSGGSLVLATREHGVILADPGGSGHTEPVGRNMRPPGASKIYDLLCDREGLLWIASSQKKLQSYAPAFESYPVTLDGIQALAVLPGGLVVAGTSRGMFYLVPGSGKGARPVPGLPVDINITCLYPDQRGGLWAGSFGSGLYWYDPVRERSIRWTEREGLVNNSILSIGGAGDTLWLATLGGAGKLVTAYDSGRPRVMPQPLSGEGEELGARFIYEVLADRRGRVWFATDGQGLACLEDGRLLYIPLRDYPELKTIYALAEDTRGHIWFSTVREGLFSYDGSGVRRIGPGEGLSEMEITSLVAGGCGRLLVVHPGGLDIVDPSDQSVFKATDWGRQYGQSEAFSAACIDASGGFWAGSGGRIVRIRSDLLPASFRPVTTLREIRVVDRPWEDLQIPGELSHDQNYIAFHFNGLWFHNPAAVLYRYKLEGVDPAWRESREPLAAYINLKPGTYRFRVQASVEGQFEGAQEAAWSFTIRPPVWQRWWFWLIALTALAAGARWWVRARERRLARELAMKRETAVAQYEALRTQINPHFLFNSFNTLIGVIEDDPSLAVTYVERLSDFYRNILQYRETDSIPLEEEIRLVQDYLYLLRQRFGEALVCDISLTDDRWRVPPLAIQILIENAIKHNIVAQSKPLHIHIVQSPAELITVTNNLQPKLQTEASTGVGLDNVARRIELLTGKRIHVRRGESVFAVALPLLPPVLINKSLQS